MSETYEDPMAGVDPMADEASKTRRQEMAKAAARVARWLEAWQIDHPIGTDDAGDLGVTLDALHVAAYLKEQAE